MIAEAVAHSRFKIEWAKNHINAVEDIVKSIIADNADPIMIQTNAQTGMAVVLVGPKDFIPVTLSLHLGDAVHALNSSLDYLWSGLERSISPGIAHSRVSFPRHETWKNLEADFSPTGKYAAIYVAFPQAKAFILDKVKPCKRSDDPSFIWRLGKIDNINKHRLLISTPYIISFEEGLILEGSDGGRMIQSPEAAIQTQGHPLTIGLTPPVKISNNPKPTVDVVFGEPEHFTRKPVVETLVNLVEAATEVVDLFNETFVK